MLRLVVPLLVVAAPSALAALGSTDLLETYTHVGFEQVGDAFETEGSGAYCRVLLHPRKNRR